MTRHALDLAGTSADPRAARTFVRDVLSTASLAGRDTDDVLLMVSELVTNAHLYAPGPIGLVVEVGRGEVRVVVRDGNPCAPVVGTLDDPQAVTGRGLGIVDRLATAWGVDLDESGKSVWFTVPVG